MAKETSDWGYDQIAGAMVNLGYRRSDQTVGNIPQRHGIPRAPRGSVRQRGQTLSAHTMSVFAGTDVFTVKVLTLRGLVTYYVLFFSHLESRKVEVSGMTQHPNERWMNQIARNMATDKWGFLDNCNYLIHDRDTKSCQSYSEYHRI